MQTSIRKFISICKAVRILSKKSDNISLPMAFGEYDLIVDAKGVISRIKVLTACKGRVYLRKGAKRNLFKSSCCEFVFVDAFDKCFLIPSFEINQTTAIQLSTCDKFLIPESK